MATDKNMKEIRPGDVLKVFHYVGARRKRHYMYKQALFVSEGRLYISHLSRLDGEPWVIGHNYYSVSVNEHLPDYEIVQRVGPE